MTISESTKEKTKIFRLSGRLDFKAMNDMQRLQEKIGQGEERSVVLNLGGVRYIDSAGLALLSMVHEELTSQNIKLYLANPQDNVRRILELGDTGKKLSIHETEEQATSV